ncbi:hypothetical protein HK105_209494, partial [Polyrhizophydium stewartii]
LWMDIIMYEPSINPGLLGTGRLDDSLILSITTREMLKCVEERDPVGPLIRQRLAFRNGWADMLDFGDYIVLAAAAAAEGIVDVLKILFESRQYVGLVEMYALCAAMGGQLKAVEWLRDIKNADVQTPAIMDAAASSGSFRLVSMLHFEGRCSSTTRAIDWAAGNGHSRVVKFLARNCSAGCTDDAFVWAYENGHSEVLDLLHNYYPERINSIPAVRFWSPRHLSSLKWLVRKRRRNLNLAELIHTVLFSGSVEMFCWLVNKISCHMQPHMLQTALMAGNMPLARWMITTKHFEIDAEAFSFDRISPSLSTLLWVIRRDARWARIIADKFAQSKWGSAITWLQRKCPGSVTQSTLEIAIRAKNHGAISCILELPDVEGLDYERIKQVAIEIGDRGMLKLISECFCVHLSGCHLPE